MIGNFYPNWPIVKCSMCGVTYSRNLKHDCGLFKDDKIKFSKNPHPGSLEVPWQCPGCKLWHRPDVKSCDCEVDLTEEEIEEFKKRISGENEVLKGEVGNAQTKTR